MPITRTALRSSPAEVDDVLWCYARLDDPNVSRETAPSSGAWAMLQWARDTRDRYYGSVLPRALAARVANGANGSAATDSGDEDFTPEDLADFRRFDQAREKLYAKGIDAKLVREVEERVCLFDAATRCEMKANAIMAATYLFALAIHDVSQAAAQRPEEFRRYLEEPEADE